MNRRDFVKKDMLDSRLIWGNDPKYLPCPLLEYTLKWQQSNKGTDPIKRTGGHQGQESLIHSAENPVLAAEHAGAGLQG